jgi:putative transposase
MLHLSARARADTLLFRTWEEARFLWLALTTRATCVGVVLMPDHVHAVVEGGQDVGRLRQGMRAYAQWRNARRGERGPVWRHRDRASVVRAGEHARRTLRYLYLNPCRAELVDDPLAWAFSSYRDALGLALPALRRAARDPERLHAWVSADPSVNVEGTALPEGLGESVSPSLAAVLAAVSSLTRTPLARMSAAGPARRLFVRAARELTRARSTEVARALGVGATAVRRSWGESDRGVALVARVAGDRRFAALQDGDLRIGRRFGPYRRRT